MKHYLNKNLNLTLLAVVLLAVVSCKKDGDKLPTEVKRDTITVIEKPADTLTTVLNRKTETNQFIIDVDASKTPVKLVEEVKLQDQQIILRLLNYDKPTLKAFIKPEQADMNIRINQIRIPDNTFDGPFSQTIEYKTPQKGEYWLVISKNNMASGNPLGKFYIQVD
ncbi:hypothetical protein [Soonwooa sp.]|uniref:hypothetical protein n=1 Tax=Soonwooa sp. TaxID=1938592 RepID=UPI00260F44D9|nr:hypothetical protein [Soonwooa sp.]